MDLSGLRMIDLGSDHGIAMARNRFLRKARQAKDFEASDAILSTIIDANPERLREHVDRLDNSVSMQRFDVASGYLAEINQRFSDVTKHASALELALLLRANMKLDRVDEAMALASKIDFGAHGDPRLGRELLAVYVAHSEVDLILELAEPLSEVAQDHPKVRARLFTVLTRIGYPSKVLTLASHPIDVRNEEPKIIVAIANAMLEARPTDPAGLQLLEDLYSVQPEVPELKVTLSKAYLLFGRAKDALQILELQPGVPVSGKQSYRQHVAETYLANDMFAEAGAIFHALAQGNPLHGGWRRSGVGAFLQAGETAKATALYEEDRLRRRPPAGDSFADRLALLADKLPEADIPKVRFDWAWRKLQQMDAVPRDREAWENACRFMSLADDLTLDWLETRPNDTDQVVARFREPEKLVTLFNEALAPGRGAFVAALHMGSLFAGPALLALHGVRFRWLASTPAIATMPSAKELISTTSSSRVAVARSVFRAINSGYAVTVAIDGGDPAVSKPVPFLGDDILVTDIVPRTVFQTGCRSFFPKVLWVGDKLDVDLVELIPPSPEDTLESYISIWFRDFMACVEDMCREAPDNFRMTGGFWRRIKL